MPRFEFRLQTLMTLRRHQRDALRSELAAALAQQRALDAEKLALDGELARHAEWLRAATTPGNIAAGKLHSAVQYERALRAQLAIAVAGQQDAQAAVENHQQMLADAESALGALEKLRQRKLEELDAQQARRDSAACDEAAARRQQR